MPELSAPVLSYRGLSQEQFRGIVLRNEMIASREPLSRVRARFIRVRGIAVDQAYQTEAAPAYSFAPVADAVGAASVTVQAPALISPSAAASAAALAAISSSSLAPAAGSLSAASVTVQGRPLMSLAARSASHAAAPLLIEHSPYTFDSIAIFDSASRLLAEVARSSGPLEAGSFDHAGTWVPASDPAELIVDGFGITAAGVPYYDTNGVDPGEEAQLFIDPLDTQLWLTR